MNEYAVFDAVIVDRIKTVSGFTDAAAVTVIKNRICLIVKALELRCWSACGVVCRLSSVLDGLAECVTGPIWRLAWRYVS